MAPTPADQSPADQSPEPDLGVLDFGFAIVGAQKSGTTSLSGMLDRHPLICKAPKKEMQYFNREDIDWTSDELDHSTYVAPRRREREILAGDATPETVFWPHALERMQRHQPQMKLIGVFRDPIERTFSQWIMHRTRLRSTAMDWPEFISWRPSELPTEIPESMAPRAFRHHTGVVRGMYGDQLRRGFEIFDRSQWLVLDFKSMLADHTGHLDRITDFLGIRRYRKYPRLAHLMAQKEQISGTPPTAAEIEELAIFFAPQCAEFSDLSGIDVTGWTTFRVLRGEQDAGELAAKFAAKAGIGNH